MRTDNERWYRVVFRDSLGRRCTRFEKCASAEDAIRLAKAALGADFQALESVHLLTPPDEEPPCV